MDAISILWRSWSPEQRCRALVLDHAETIRCVDEQIRKLWTAEMQLRSTIQASIGVPLSERLSTHALLTNMHFDEKGFFVAASLSSALGGKQHQSVQWRLYEDPDALLGAFSRIFAMRGGMGLQKLMKMSLWPKLLLPEAKSWVELEFSLAQVIAQMLFSAEAYFKREAIALSNSECPCLGNDCWIDEKCKPISQQSKRQRKKASERKRREEYRDAKRGARGVEPQTNSNGHDELEIDLEPTFEVDASTCVATISHESDIDEVTTDMRFSVNCEPQDQSCDTRIDDILSESDRMIEESQNLEDCENGQELLDAIALQQKAQHLAVELQSRENTNPRSAAAATLQNVGPSVFPTILRLALEALGAKKSVFDDVGQASSKSEDDMWKEEVSSGGQGRPLFSRKCAAVSSTPCIGAGRGRPLIPSDRMASIPPPDGLSRWGDACLLRDYSIIPEETVGDCDSSRSDISMLSDKITCPTPIHDFQLPSPPEVSGSAPESPLMRYSLYTKTPSTPGTPIGEYIASDHTLQRPFVPNYVTVPLSDARCCPNCGSCFAIADSRKEASLLGPSF